MNTPDRNRTSVLLKFWTGGINSLLNPAFLGQSQYVWGENVMNRGGIIQTRPGFNLLASLPGGNLQGFTIFSPLNSAAIVVAAVDGRVYAAHWPKMLFDLIEEVRFNPSAKYVNFCQCIQSTKRNDDNTIKIIDPVRVLMMADGESPTCSWDGIKVTVHDASGPKFETPAGTWMRWVASRLWISNGPVVRVSDLGDPTSFTEDQFLATRSFFQMPDIITGMIEIANQRGLLVFTDRTTTLIKSFVPDRKTWGSTPEFSTVLFPDIGCDGGRTTCSQYGLTYWHSHLGLVGLDAAMDSQHTSRVMPVDGPMMRSRRLLSPDMTKACAVAYENIMLVSVPAGGKNNEQTWVMDQSPLENLATSTAWASIWTGVRPVEWAQGQLGGRKRLLFASYDRTPTNGTHIHIWEALREERKVGGGRISCQVQHATIAGDRLKSFKYAEFEVVELLGNVSLKVFLGGTRGPWYEIGNYELRAEEGSLGSKSQPLLTVTSILQAFRPQCRTLRTAEFNSQNLPCTPESSGNRPGRDKGFCLLFEWKGRMGLRDVRMVLDDATESDRGKCTPSEDGQLNVVLENGSVPV